MTPGAGGITNFGGLRAEPYAFRQQEGQLDITLEVIDVGRTLFANLKYKTERFERSTIEQMRVHFETLLEGVVENPNRRVSEIPLLTAEEQSRILREWNGTASAYPAELGLDGLFEAQVKRTPERVAILQAGREMTYGVLNDRANQIARRLRSMGVGPGVLVAVGLPRTPDLVATLLAVAKAGGAYVPMDPAFPAQRLSWMFEDARPAVVVTDCALATTWPEHAARVLCLDDPSERLTEEGAANLGILVHPRGARLRHLHVGFDGTAERGADFAARAGELPDGHGAGAGAVGKGSLAGSDDALVRHRGAGTVPAARDRGLGRAGDTR